MPPLISFQRHYAAPLRFLFRELRFRHLSASFQPLRHY
jgi:hypothetical protein